MQPRSKDNSEYLDDDRLYFKDFFRITAGQLVQWESLWGYWAIAFLLMSTLSQLSVLDSFVMNLKTTELILLYLVLVAIVHVIFVATSLVRAWKLKKAYQHLPLTVNGLGRLIHTCGVDGEKLLRCRININTRDVVLNYEGYISADDLYVRSLVATAFGLIIREINLHFEAVRRSSNEVPGWSQLIAPETSVCWSGSHITVLLNRHLAGKMLKLIATDIVQLQNRASIIDSIDFSIR